jgi:signal transduction histidine kinase
MCAESINPVTPRVSPAIASVPEQRSLWKPQILQPGDVERAALAGPFCIMIEALHDPALLLDTRGIVLACNSAWREFARKFCQVPELFLEGANYALSCHAVLAAPFAEGLKQVLEGKLSHFQRDYRCTGKQSAAYSIQITSFLWQGESFVLVMHQAKKDAGRRSRATALPVKPLGLHASKEQIATLTRDLQTRLRELQSLLESEKLRARAYLQKTQVRAETLVRERTRTLEARNGELLRKMEERKALEKELLELTEQERKTLGLDLHDELGQQLTGLLFMAKGLEVRLQAENSKLARDASNLRVLIGGTLEYTRVLARDLAYIEFENKSLPKALKGLASRARKMFKVKCVSRTSGDFSKLEASAARQLVNIAKEALTNAVKHGKTRQISFKLSRSESRILLEIKNDGRGFKPDSRAAKGSGLRNMHYRAEILGATLQIISRPRKGTLIRCILPESSGCCEPKQSRS